MYISVESRIESLLSCSLYILNIRKWLIALRENNNFCSSRINVCALPQNFECCEFVSSINLIWIGPLELSLRFTKYVYVHLLDAVCSLKHLCFYINFYIMLLQNSVAVKNCAYSSNVWSAVVNVYLHSIHDKLWGVLTQGWPHNFPDIMYCLNRYFKSYICIIASRNNYVKLYM